MPVNRARHLATAVLACTISATATEAGPPVPDGPQFVVAAGFDSYNSGGGVEMDDDGQMVVSWNFFFGGPAARGVASDGTPGAFFFLEPYGALVTFEPMDSATLANDDFVFIWEGWFEGLQARRYDSSGTPLAPAIQVTPGGGEFFDVEPAIAGWAPSTNMLMVWATDNPATGDTDGLGIDAQAFNAAGVPLGPVFRVNTHVSGDQDAPDIAVAPDNGFLIVWESDGSDGSDGDGSSIQGHHFTSGGTGDTAFQVNSFTVGSQRRPAVALAPDGRALVVWEGASNGSDPDGSIQGRIVDADGNPLGADFQINTTTPGDQTRPRVAATGDDCFQVVWLSADGVFSQAVSVDGALLGAEVPVSTTGPFGYRQPTVAANALVSVVSWAEPDERGSEDVYGQRYRFNLFADGFESGDTTAWSTTVP